MSSVISLDNLPADTTFMVTQYRYIHNNMGNSFILYCINGSTIKYVLVTEGFVFDHMMDIVSNNRTTKFPLMKASIPETGGYSYSVDDDFSWIVLR